MKNCLSCSSVLSRVRFIRIIRAFSLVEMLMALLVASLLLAALSPVITRKLNDSMTVSVEGEIPGKTTKTHEIIFGSEQCPAGTGEIKTASDGSEYCEGEFVVPYGYNGPMKVTAIGAGGGGAAASTAGYVEYKNPGEGQTFIVPPAVNQIQATLIGAGAAGGAGGKRETYKDWTTGGTFTWTDMPANIRNTYVKVTACGAGGGGGGGRCRESEVSWAGGGGGGSGGYMVNKVALIGSSNLALTIGGGGGLGASNWCGGGGRASNGGGGGGSGCSGANGEGEGGSGGVCQGHAGGNHGYYTYSPGQGGVGGYPGGVLSGGALANTIFHGGTGGVGGNGGDGYTNFDINADHTGVAVGPGSGGALGGGGGGYATAGVGGGGGGGATAISGFIGSFSHLLIPGGGGGAALSTGDGDSYNFMGVGGGGGGGNGGGNGGGAPTGSANRGGYAGTGGTNGNWSIGGEPATLWSGSGTSNTNCSGGNGYNNGGGRAEAKNGKDGAVRIQYAANASGGSGGGGGAIVPYQTVTVNPLETLIIDIAQRSPGAATGGYKSDGTFVVGNWSAEGGATYLKRSTTTLLTTSMGHGTHHGNSEGSCSGVDCRSGSVFNGKDYQYSNNWNGASNVNGLAANNAPYGTTTPGANDSDGGRGGYVNVFGKQFCTPGAGGTESHPDGYDAAEYGCGGGGGSRGGKGGSGSGGYARISWNMYWDIALNSGNGDYKYAETGGGGGGASGNALVYMLNNVKSGEKIKIRIGKGGAGGYVVSTASGGEVIRPKKGGDTVFAYGTNKAVKAGGGLGGIAPKIEDGVLKNGSGGLKSTLCSVRGKNFIDIACASKTSTDCCITGQNGSDAQEANGGRGANLTGYGEGGAIRSSGSGNTDGIDAVTGFGAGGGGASLRHLGALNVSETTSNPTRGGQGSNGKIILEWWE